MDTGSKEVASRASNIEMSMLVSDLMVMKNTQRYFCGMYGMSLKGTKKKKEWILCVLIMVWTACYTNWLVDFYSGCG